MEWLWNMAGWRSYSHHPQQSPQALEKGAAYGKSVQATEADSSRRVYSDLPGRLEGQNTARNPQKTAVSASIASPPHGQVTIDLQKARELWKNQFESIFSAIKESNKSLERMCSALLSKKIISRQDFTEYTKTGTDITRRDYTTRLLVLFSTRYDNSNVWMAFLQALSLTGESGKTVVNDIATQLGIPLPTLTPEDDLVAEGLDIVSSYQVPLAESIATCSVSECATNRCSEIIECLQLNGDILACVAREMVKAHFIDENDIETAAYTAASGGINQALMLWTKAQNSITTLQNMAVFLKALNATGNISCQALARLIAQDTGMSTSAYLP
ncbi:hypothetical protein [Parendozoicomonas sp. Alg238-R29]|uniref:hypothetical protein n=1 Tax=Parendozoicomonas sp. Alg238-R29 TaxID=2993446 RepID=UPI00248ECE25|nr:hypothetical protein [Parendozoicomonas sp. Alg238-R29]